MNLSDFREILVTVLKYNFDPFQASFPFRYALKASENLCFF